MEISLFLVDSNFLTGGDRSTETKKQRAQNIQKTLNSIQFASFYFIPFTVLIQ